MNKKNFIVIIFSFLFIILFVMQIIQMSRLKRLETMLADHHSYDQTGILTSEMTESDNSLHDYQALKELTLPAGPSEDEVTEYLDKINMSLIGKNTFSSDDPEIAYLMAVGPEFLSLLYQDKYLRNMEFYIQLAADMLINESHKQLVLDQLPSQPNLIRHVVTYGWEEDAKDIILDKLKNPDEYFYFPDEWFKAALSFGQQGIEALLDYIQSADYIETAYLLLKDYTDIDLRPIVEKHWDDVFTLDNYRMFSLCKIALNEGIQEAPQVLVHVYKAFSDDQYYGDEFRKISFRYFMIEDKNIFAAEEIADWIISNSDSLVYIPEQKKYGIK